MRRGGGPWPRGAGVKGALTLRDDPDAAPIADEAWFEKAQLGIPAHLKYLWVQIDEDLMSWFRNKGMDWPAKINDALRAHVDGQRKRRRRAG